ncbi:CubicO group peptidase, beta-lactamase class C family [Arthrobacter sp. cf158]|uniref:serine hydrolase domain-containing protein n=1 Tax=Arthrobacter sp. cf158 TaxID=1761744 RepID=UPI00089CB57B|nr:serine hydrolase domain-containing protein [Arthrobacter sp. cf158]SDW87752.1 CubicO group peptidase, beta-lactamase class C family [Arthrobacter sp. cf158]
MNKIFVKGSTESFEGLADVFGRLAAQQSKGGAAVTVFQGGRCVADLSFGDYSTSSRQVVFSVSKLILAIALHRVAERGALNLDAQLSEAWPGFGSAGGSNVTVRDVLAHRTSLAALDVVQTSQGVLSGGDREAVLAAAATAHRLDGHGYHAVTFGTVLGAVVEEALGISVTELIRREIADPLGVDLVLGGRQTEIHPVLFSEPAEASVPGAPLPQRDGLLEALVADPELFNSDAFLEAGLPSMGVVTTASSLARIMASTVSEVDGIRLLDANTVDSMTRPCSSGLDLVLGVPTRFGSGTQLSFPRLPIGRQSFGHEGAGGSVAFADPELALGVGFTTNLFPSAPGASPLFLGLLPTIRHIANERIAVLREA